MADNFKLTFTIKKHPESQNVYFKVDGGRFDQERTIKFNINSVYHLEFLFKPAQLIQSLTVHGGRIDAKLKSRDESETVYTTNWSSAGIDVDKKGKRHELPIVIELENNAILKQNIQGKFYGEKETSHSHWGNCVSHIEYDCKIAEGSSFVEVVKETYR